MAVTENSSSAIVIFAGYIVMSRTWEGKVSGDYNGRRFCKWRLRELEAAVTLPQRLVMSNRVRKNES